ncbi:hypothetical protein [Nonomuraea sp. NPDC049400]
MALWRQTSGKKHPAIARRLDAFPLTRGRQLGAAAALAGLGHTFLDFAAV